MIVPFFTNFSGNDDIKKNPECMSYLITYNDSARAERPLRISIDRSSIFFIIYYTCLVWYSFFAVLLCDFMVEKCFFCQGTAKTSPSEFVRALI
jgi:hypothetical protein